jgi:hypothetical protein
MSRERPDSRPSLLKRPDAGASPQRTPRGGRHDEDEIADAAWLFAWSHEALRPAGERLRARFIYAG